MMQLKTDHYSFAFMALDADARDNVQPLMDKWQSSITIALMEADALDMTALVIELQALLRSGFNGWIVAAQYPYTMTSLRIRKPKEVEDSPDNALLICTVGYQVFMPAELKGE